MPAVFLARTSLALAVCLGLLASAHASPEMASRFYEDALNKFEKKDFDGAVVQLKNALQQDSKLLAAHLLLAKTLARTGNLTAAQAALEEALKLGIHRGEVVVPLAQIYLALGYPAKVIEGISTAGLQPALQVEVLTLRATAYAESGQPRLASQAFAEARAIGPKSVTPLIAEVPFLISQGQSDQALARATEAVKLAPDSAYAWNVYGVAKHAALDLAGALAAYSKALSLDPGVLDARIARAAFLIDLKRGEEAAKDLDFIAAAAIDDPGISRDPRLPYLRALLARSKGDAAAVKTALGQVVALIDGLRPEWLAKKEQLLMVGAMSHHSLGNFAKAREYLEIIIQRNAGSLGARRLLARTYVDTREYARAQPLLEALQKSVPADPQVQFLLGSVYAAQRRYAEAVVLLEKAAALTGSAEMYRTLALSQLELGRVEAGQANLEKSFAADPGDSQSGMALANLYMARGQPGKAVQTAEAIVKARPANLTVLNFLGVIKRGAGDKAGARAAYSQVLAKDPAFAPAALNLARLDAAEGRFEDGRRRLVAMLVKNAEDSDALYELGKLEQSARRPAEALRLWKKADELKRRDTRPGLAMIELQTGQRLFVDALGSAKALASKYPNDPAVQVALGRAYLAVGNVVAARSAFQGASSSAGLDAATQVAIGRLQLAAGNPDGAIENAQKVLSARPDDLDALVLRIEAETRRGDPARADAALKTLVQKYPGSVAALLAGANLAMMRGQYAAAVAGYRSVLERDATTATALNLVQAYGNLGKAAEARVFLEGWLKTRPDDRTALRALAGLQADAGTYEAAKKSYNTILAAEPEDFGSLNNLAMVLHKLNDPSAPEVAEKALRLMPESPEIADTLGWILVQQGRIESGLRHLRAARLRSPGNGEIRFHLAYALAKAGRKGEAKEELIAALAARGGAPLPEAFARLKAELSL